jgi:hypothetical protein
VSEYSFSIVLNKKPAAGTAGINENTYTERNRMRIFYEKF